MDQIYRAGSCTRRRSGRAWSADAAAARSKNRKIVVMGPRHGKQPRIPNCIEARGLSAREKACPLLTLVEEGWVEQPVTEELPHLSR